MASIEAQSVFMIFLRLSDKDLQYLQYKILPAVSTLQVVDSKNVSNRTLANAVVDLARLEWAVKSFSRFKPSDSDCVFPVLSQEGSAIPKNTLLQLLRSWYGIGIYSKFRIGIYSKFASGVTFVSRLKKRLRFRTLRLVPFLTYIEGSFDNTSLYGDN